MPPRDLALKTKYQRGQLLVNKNITVFFSVNILTILNYQEVGGGGALIKNYVKIGG